MAVTTAVVSNEVIGRDRQGVVDVTLDSSYPTGGEAIALATVFGWSTLLAVTSIRSKTAGGYVPQYDDAGATINMFEAGADGAALDEVADTTDLSAQVVTVTAIGR